MSSYEYDLIDIGRQVLSKLATKYWKRTIIAYKNQELNALIVFIKIIF